MRIHDEEKLSKCDQLIQEVSNEHHEITSSKEEFERRDPIIHVEKKPLQCYFCPHTFASTEEMKIHEDVHTGIWQPG